MVKIIMTVPVAITLEDAQQIINQQVDVINELTGTIEKQEGQIAWLTRQIFGRKSERLTDSSHPLFPESAEAQGASDALVEKETITYKREKPGGKRQAIPDHLPRVDRVYDLPEDQKVCPKTGKPLVRLIDKDVSEQLAYEPGSIYVIRHIRLKYARLEENLDGSQPEIVVAPRPLEGLPKSKASPSLLAQVAVSKYTDHLPLYRLEKIFKRSGAELARSSMCRWMQGIGSMCRPLLALMKQRILLSKVIQSDDTPVRQQNGKYSTKQCRFWSYVGDGQRGGRYVLYDYTQTRSRAGPASWFTHFDGRRLFTGYLQCDAYAGYQLLFTSSGDEAAMTHVGCWAHARRKFYDVREKYPGPCHWALGQIKQLYDIEREAGNPSLCASDRLSLREEKSRPLVDEFFNWCRDQSADALPKSGLGEALQYALNQEVSLRRYLADGDLQIDNNDCERSLRGIALGRKNWLFTGSDSGGRAAAALFSLIGSAQLNDVEPLAYLTDVITRLPATPPDQIEQFLPDVWKVTNQ